MVGVGIVYGGSTPHRFLFFCVGVITLQDEAVVMMRRLKLTPGVSGGQAMQQAVERLSQYVTTLEERMESIERKKK